MGVGVVSAPRPVPTGESMLSAVSASPEPAANVAVRLVGCPTYICVELAAIVAVGVGGGVTVRDAGVVGPEPYEAE